MCKKWLVPRCPLFRGSTVTSLAAVCVIYYYVPCTYTGSGLGWLGIIARPLSSHNLLIHCAHDGVTLAKATIQSHNNYVLHSISYPLHIHACMHIPVPHSCYTYRANSTHTLSSLTHHPSSFVVFSFCTLVSEGVRCPCWHSYDKDTRLYAIHNNINIVLIHIIFPNIGSCILLNLLAPISLGPPQP